MKVKEIVILPGWLLGSTRFLPLTDELQKHGFSVHVIDFPGFEQGEKIFRPWTLTDYVDYLRNYLKAHKIQNPLFIGHSFGGRVALKLLNENPQIGPALILTGTPGYRDAKNGRLSFIRTTSMVGQAALANLPLPYFREIAQKMFNIIVGARDLSKLSGFMRQTFINIVEEDLELYMKSISIPTLLLWGARDGIVPISIAQKMHGSIAHSELKIIPDVYHNFPYRQPKLFVEAVSSFLSRHHL